MPGMISGSINAQWTELISKVLSLARKAMVPFVIAGAWEGALRLVMLILKFILKLDWKYIFVQIL